MQEDRAQARTKELADALRALKERTPHSYETLATRLGISRSALHRYCSGKSVPGDFSVVKQLAGQAKASREELAELHRLWALATERPAARTPERAPAEPEPEPEAEAGAGAAVEPEPDSDPKAEPEPKTEPGPKTEPEPEAGPEAGPEAAAEPDVAAESEPGPAVRTDTPTDEPTAVPPPASGSRRRVWAIAAAAVAVVLVIGLAWALFGGDDEAKTVADDRSLFTGECEEPVREGQHDACVREVQELLADTGVTIGIDGIFGPETLRRVEAFQVRAGLDVDGIVGDKTKRALYDGDISLTTWGEERVAKRIREVFTEEPDKAVKIARCQSFLDPLHILPNVDATRNWGLFQISDARLRDLRATPEKALDPEWNIKAAHKLWAQNEDFSHWPHCAAAAEEDGEGDGKGGDSEGDGS